MPSKYYPSPTNVYDIPPQSIREWEAAEEKRRMIQEYESRQRIGASNDRNRPSPYRDRLWDSSIERLNENQRLWDSQPPYPIDDPKPAQSPTEINDKFKALMVGSGYKKPLPPIEQYKHELELGPLDQYKAKAPEPELKVKAKAKMKPEVPKRICGICFDPACPYSD